MFHNNGYCKIEKNVYNFVSFRTRYHMELVFVSIEIIFAFVGVKCWKYQQCGFRDIVPMPCDVLHFQGLEMNLFLESVVVFVVWLNLVL